MTTHVSKRGSRYYIRRKIPVDLQAHYGGRKEIVRALGTSDPSIARVRCREEGVKIDKEFLNSRAALPDVVTVRALTPEQFRAWENYQRDEEDRLASWNPDEEEAEWARIRERKAREAARQQQRIDAYEAALTRVLAKSGPQALPGLTPIASGVRQGGRARIPASQADRDKRLVAVAERWAKERKPDKRTVDIMDRVVDKFIAMVGDLPIDQITRAHAVQFKDKLLAAGTSPRHTDGELTNMGTLLNFAARNLLAAPDIFRGIRVGVRRNAKAARLPFDKAALNAIFNSPVFTQSVRPSGGAGEAAYWIPLLAYTSGARLEELAQLAPDDVYEESYHDAGGVERSSYVLRITNEGEGQGVKNSGSVRRFPIHAELLRRGFIEYCAGQKGGRLFPLLTKDRDGREGANFGKWFGKYLRGVCRVSDPRMVFHSFRHTFKDMARQAGIEEAVSDAMSGHVDGKVSRIYGGLTYPLAPLVDAVARLRLPVTPP